MKAIQIAIKNLKEVVRNFKSNAIIFVLPFAFMAIFAIAFGRSGAESSLTIGIHENDTEVARTFTQALEDMKTPKGNELFRITKYRDEDEVIQKVEKSEIMALVDFTDNGGIKVKGNVVNPSFNEVTGILSRIVNEMSGKAQDDKFIVESIGEMKEEFSPFEFIAPGMMVYGILMLIPQVATNLAMIGEKNQIFRYFTSKASGLDIIGGYLISQTILGAIQTAILFGTALMFGFEPKGSLITALIIAIPTTLFSVGCGLLIGALTRKSDNAGNIGTLLSVILGFMSGSFFISQSGDTLFKELAGFDIFPSAYATKALSSVLTYGRKFSDIQGEFTVLTLSSIAILIMGIVLFNWRQLRKIE